VLAHQGGWDEILIVVGPMVLIGGVLAVIRRRVGTIPADDVPPNSLADEIDPDQVDQ
jgi:hypothetical protein